MLAFYLFARQDDPHSGLGAVDPLFAAWQAHLVANPVEGEVLFIRQMSARANDPYPVGRTACILDLKRNYIERWGMARIYSCAFAGDRDLLHRLGFRPLEHLQIGMPETMVLEVPGGDIFEWVSALVDAGQRGMAHGGRLDFARDRREIVVEGRTIELTPLEARVLGDLIDRAPAVVRREDLIERIWRRDSNVVDTVVRTLRKKLGPKRECIQTIAKAGYRYVGSGTSAEPSLPIE